MNQAPGRWLPRRYLPLLVPLLVGAPPSRAEGPQEVVVEPILSRVALEVLTTEPAAACQPVTLRLQAKDSLQNSLRQSVVVSLCHTASSMKLVHHTLGSGEVAGSCLKGTLSSEGAGEVTWASPVAQAVTFEVWADGMVNGSARVTWEGPRFSAAHSTLSFKDVDEEVPGLRLFTGELGVRFEPRDACGSPARLPEDQLLAFSSAPPLLVFTPPSPEEDGRWLSLVRLMACSDNSAEPLSLWPTLNQEPVFPPSSDSDKPLQRQVRPLCLPPEARLSIRAEPEKLAAEPGERVDFVVELRNEGQETFPKGLLGLATEGLMGLELRLDDQLLPVGAQGVALPQLLPATTVTVRGRAQVDARTELPVRVKVWYATSRGFPLSETQSLDILRKPVAVDVGWGCGTTPASGPLSALLVLIVLASRPGRNSRRVGRGGSTRH
jgi:hypothetical protein